MGAGLNALSGGMAAYGRIAKVVRTAAGMLRQTLSCEDPVIFGASDIRNHAVCFAV